MKQDDFDSLQRGLAEVAAFRAKGVADFRLHRVTVVTEHGRVEPHALHEPQESLADFP